MVGGIIESWIAFTHRAASSAPPAPSKWPVIDLVELMCRLDELSPRASFMALVSCVSFNGVDVP